MNYQINIQNQSQVNIIRQLLAFEGKANQQDVWFKKTASKFKRKYGFDIFGAPLIFKAGDMIYKLSFIQSNYPKHLGGRRYEMVQYLPIVRVGEFFKRLEIK